MSRAKEWRKHCRYTSRFISDYGLYVGDRLETTANLQIRSHMNNAFQIRVAQNGTIQTTGENNSKQDDTVTLKAGNAVIVTRLENSLVRQTASKLAKE